MLSAARRGDERGSVAMVVMVLFVMASLATVMVARDTSELRSVRTVQDRAAALAATDVALAAGVARAAIETAPAFTENGTAGGAAWTVTARRIDAGRWELQVTATTNGARRRVDAALERRAGSGWVVGEWQEVA